MPCLGAFKLACRCFWVSGFNPVDTVRLEHGQSSAAPIFIFFRHLGVARERCRRMMPAVSFLDLLVRVARALPAPFWAPLV